jgi:hypothetical protein
MQLSERMVLLIEYIQKLNTDRRHRITVDCRGNEPWEIEEHVTRTRIGLKPGRTIK